MKSKKSAETPPIDDESEMGKVEKKVKRMMDPAEPDPEPEIPEELPTEIKLEPQAEELASTAPELKDAKTAAAEPAAISDPAEDEAPNAEAGKDEPEAAEAEPAELAPDDTETAKAVDEIVVQESDQLLAAEDAEIAKAFEDKKPSMLGRFKNALSRWWSNPAARRTTLAVAVGLVAATFLVPTSRYFILNMVGVRSSASVKILDESTHQPLKNVKVSLRGQTALTDSEGVAKLARLKLGTAEFAIEKRAFAPINQKITIGWGSNPLGNRSLSPAGIQYAFFVNDYLSGKPIKKVEAASGEASAVSDDAGKIKLTIDKTNDAPVEVIINGEDLRAEKLIINADDKTERNVQMVPARKHVFISKRSGKYDVYKIDADGKNEQLALGGTGSERDDMALVAHPTRDLAALVSTRANARNGDGYLLSTLTLIDLSDNSKVEIAQSERVQIIDWIGDKLFYVRIAAGTSGGNPKRHRLMSYDSKTTESKEIASSNYFNEVIIARGNIYYAPSSAYQTGVVALYKVNTDGNNKQTILPQETWSAYRTSYRTMALAVGQDWYEYNLDTSGSSKLAGEPANIRSRAYADSPDGQRSLWADQRDGKGVLLSYNISKNEDQEIHKRSGLKTPIRWLNNSNVVFRVHTEQETADYAISLNGGEPKKIRDVTNTAGLEDWYYY